MQNIATIENKNQFYQPLAYWIKLIENLPDHILEFEYGVRIPFGRKNPVEQIMYAIRAKYRALASWLRFYLLDDQGILAELNFTKKSHHKPVAEIAVARYKLAQELQIYLPDLVDPFEKDNNPCNPSRWMFSCIVQDCNYDLRKSGLLDLQTTEGKVALYNRVQKNLRWLEEAPNRGIGKSEKLKLCLTPSGGSKSIEPIIFLDECSLQIARRDPEFQENYHNAYIKTLRSCYNRIRNDPFFSVTCLDNKGNLVTKAKGKGKSKKAGFEREI
jgi:hypothetical protein